jgi:predicted MPP superfamily phosphohydrolase
MASTIQVVNWSDNLIIGEPPMPLDDPQILSPSPGLPFLLERAGSCLHVHVRSDADDETLRRWAEPLHLRPVADSARVALELVAIARPDTGETPRSFTTLRAVLPSDASLVRLDFAIGDGPASTRPARYELFGIWRHEQRLRSRCVALRARRDSRLSLAFASDLHVAAIWDSIDAAIANHAADLHETFLHPGRLLQGFVERANGLAAAGELDLVILGGDLVDHVRPGPHANVCGSNVDHLIELLDGLRVPSFVIPGNHDYRLHAWRPRIYPYESVAVPVPRAAAALRRAGLWDALPWRLSDLRALHTTDEHGTSALADHLLRLAPKVDYTVDLDEIRLAFVSTGRDVLPRWHSVERGRRRVFLRSLPGSWEHPDSEGLTQAQVDRIGAAVGGTRGAAVFLHAPLLNPPPGMRIESRLPHLRPGDDAGRAATARFERHLARSGLRQGVFFRNPAGLIRHLATARNGAAVFSGHVHQPHAALLDPAHLTIQSVGFPWRRNSSDAVLLANAPALGQTAMHDGPAPGFLHARFTGGRLDEVSRHLLP